MNSFYMSNQLWTQAQLGRKYRRELEDDVVRLCLALELGAEEPVLRSVMEKAAAEDLLKLRDSLDQRLAECMPVFTQLGASGNSGETVESGFLI